MGIFDFLKQFNKKKEIKEIKLGELETWIDSWHKKTLEDADLGLVSIREKIANERDNLVENIQKLNKAELKKPSISERVKQIMEGNRETYTLKLKSLLEKIDLPEKFDEILEFCDSFDGALDHFAKNSIRNYNVLQEFFVEENNAVSANIRKLDELVKRVKKIVEDARIKEVNELKNKVKEVQQKIKLKAEHKEEIKRAKEELQKEIKKSKEKESKIKELKEGNKYQEFINQSNKKKLLEQEIEEMKIQPLRSFSTITASLKKYERLTMEYELIRRYLDNPLKALTEDKELKIVELIIKMKELIIKGKLELSEKKKGRTLLELEKFSKDYFEIFLSKYNELDKKLGALKSEIEKVEVTKEIEELQEILNQDIIKAEEEGDKVKKIIDELESINIDVLRKDLESSIIESIGEEVKIIF